MSSTNIMLSLDAEQAHVLSIMLHDASLLAESRLNGEVSLSVSHSSSRRTESEFGHSSLTFEVHVVSAEEGTGKFKAERIEEPKPFATIEEAIAASTARHISETLEEMTGGKS